ncbi:MAG: D-alanine--D-alanine ligase [bacterium]|nr:D-alanine--D-alanine ligase [bacterium]
MKIAVLTGGDSNEREVAFWSAENVVASLKKENYEVTVFDVPKEIPRFMEQYKEFDVAIPVLHGSGGEDGEIQDFLNGLKVPFIFSDVDAHVIGINKELSKEVVGASGLNVPEAHLISKDDEVEFTHPIVVKPNAGGSTIGVSVVRSPDELEAALELGFTHDDNLLLEDFIEGDEVTVSVIEEDGKAIALPVTMIVPVVENGIYDFEAKYGSETPAKHILPAPISDELTRSLQEQAVMAHEAIGARHVSRSDFIIDEFGKTWFLEINTIPGITNSSILPESIRYSGRDFGVLLKQWIKSVI